VFGIKTQKQPALEFAWQTCLADYVTALDYCPQGKWLAVSSAAGEVFLYPALKHPEQLAESAMIAQAATGKSVDCLAFSADGQFLAAGGQEGWVKIWHIAGGTEGVLLELLVQLDHAPAWVDRLAWSPTQNYLAFSLGKYVQVWDADTGDIATTLNFETSSALALDWHPAGKRLAVGGYQGVKVWDSQDWDDDPYLIMVPSASVVVAWSPNGQYLASGNLDRTITLLEWDSAQTPWVMRGFPGKIRLLSWSTVSGKQKTSILASSSIEGVVIWEKLPHEQDGWDGRVLERHQEMVEALDFQPNSLLLASAGRDGQVYLWQKAKIPLQVITGAPSGFSCLAWHPQGQQLALGGHQGELMVWSKLSRSQGFGRNLDV
jgi:WD40 repeat protein